MHTRCSWGTHEGAPKVLTDRHPIFIGQCGTSGPEHSVPKRIMLMILHAALHYYVSTSTTARERPPARADRPSPCTARCETQAKPCTPTSSPAMHLRTRPHTRTHQRPGLIPSSHRVRTSCCSSSALNGQPHVAAVGRFRVIGRCRAAGGDGRRRAAAAAHLLSRAVAMLVDRSRGEASAPAAPERCESGGAGSASSKKLPFSASLEAFALELRTGLREKGMSGLSESAFDEEGIGSYRKALRPARLRLSGWDWRQRARSILLASLAEPAHREGG